MAAEKPARKATTGKAARPAQKAAAPAPAPEDPTMSLADLAAGIAALEGLPDVERARQAGLLFDAAQRLLPKVRQAAIYAATRKHGSYGRVAAELGITPAAISHAINQYRKP
jgi:hypothetical protein